MRIMAIDYGDAHTGIAISDPTGLLAGFTTVINSRRQEVVVEQVTLLAKEHEMCIRDSSCSADRPPSSPGSSTRWSGWQVSGASRCCSATRRTTPATRLTQPEPFNKKEHLTVLFFPVIFRLADASPSPPPG